MTCKAGFGSGIPVNNFMSTTTVFLTGIQEGKNDPQKWKKLRNFMF
jgi:hypothetical protein